MASGAAPFGSGVPLTSLWELASTLATLRQGLRFCFGHRGVRLREQGGDEVVPHQHQSVDFRAPIEMRIAGKLQEVFRAVCYEGDGSQSHHACFTFERVISRMSSWVRGTSSGVACNWRNVLLRRSSRSCVTVRYFCINRSRILSLMFTGGHRER